MARRRRIATAPSTAWSGPEAIGGVPAVCRTDRMGALGTSQGSRFVLHPAATEFAAHDSNKIASCRANER